MTDSHERIDTRREFLKKAGTAVWVVPVMQVVNMATAQAGVEGSVVTTTRDPSTTTSSTTTSSTTTSSTTTSSTTSTTTTTQPPDCEEFVICRIKADWTDGGWVWDMGVGANDCIQDGDFERCLGSEIASIMGDATMATVTVDDYCEVNSAVHKAGESCVEGSISADGRTATFTADQEDISHVELVVVCCIDQRV